MEYDPSDSSGTDDDLPPSYQNRNARGGPRVSGNGRSTAVVGGGGPGSYSRGGGAHSDMESQIHMLEQEAYCSVLRAFKAQADAITWEKESLITELRKELRVSDKEHRELLGRVNADDIIRRIREWRQGGRAQTSLVGGVQPGMDPVPSPTVSASRKRQKTGSQPMASLSSVPTSMATPPAAALHPQPPQPPPPVAVPMQPSTSSAAKKGVPPPFSKGKKAKPGQKLPSGVKTMPYSSAGPSTRGPPGGSRSASGALATSDHAEAAAPYNPLIGRKVRTRWPEDNSFYEAVITDYDAEKGLHALVYDMNTPNETWEWVNLKEISPEDIRWEGEDPGINQQRSGRGGGGPAHGGVKKSMGRGGGAMPGGGRGRGSLKNMPKKDSVIPPSQNGIGRKNPDDIEILHTETLIKEVERVFSANHPDPSEIEKAKKVLKEHEQSLIDAIARLAEASDGESGKY
ncbi:Protein EMSY-LIKE 3 [Carex littledalei]|uniref:Protein EMSY-LIKE 3 n=1 Tax=Carex littledalei TaxID=544730 RepID=A0A833QPZ3_9POAL|nr:Protein EMSY-LIKE 3 [Carex littledalei]